MAIQQLSFRAIPNNTNQFWYCDSGLRDNIAHCLGLCLVIFYLDDTGLLNGLQALESWQVYLNHPKGMLLGLYAATLYLPTIFTAYIGDIISHHFGRRIALLLGSFFVLAGGLINAFATNPAMWIIGRVVIGGGGGLAKVAAPALIQEIAHPRLRPMIASCYYPFFYFGTLLSALLCFAGLYLPGNWSWRVPSIAQIIGPAAVLATVFSCPESPRWLVSKGRSSEAAEVLGKYHANGLRDDPLVRWELAEIEAAIEEENDRHQNSYMGFFQSWGNRRRLYILVSLSIGQNWVGNGVISYYLTPVLKSVGIESPVQITLLTSGLAIWNLILAFLAALNVERFGRRTLFFISIIGMLISYGLVMGFSAGFTTTQNRGLGVAVVPFLFIYYGFYDIAWTPLPVPYTAEILPFGLRTKGLAIFASVGTLANSFNQFVNPIALEAIAWRYYAIYIAILLFYLAFAYFMYPETKGRTVEEVSAVFNAFDDKEEDPRELAQPKYEDSSFVGASSHRENV
ncbi:general substrate transporter [Aspergillus steynii IBT 23096]|uniref:General substrate transporter n=1 Tax=Aspergillus steynii IBT 23096 TaxID=1392250 RepID=A0A2I2GK78_9EURO|nr:general substrate transporter [Aspergillus steynii IBT 23096]PLB53259.1 general substrate transporter [Aspergillus steynii IBT 23096]